MSISEVKFKQVCVTGAPANKSPGILGIVDKAGSLSTSMSLGVAGPTPSTGLYGSCGRESGAAGALIISIAKFGDVAVIIAGTGSLLRSVYTIMTRIKRPLSRVTPGCETSSITPSNRALLPGSTPEPAEEPPYPQPAN